MRLKTKLVVAIVALVFLVATILSWLYLNQLLQQLIEQSYKATDVVAHQLLFATRTALETGLRNSKVNVNDPAELRTAVAESLRKDIGLKELINSEISYSPTVLDIAIADRDGRALVTDDPLLQDKPLPVRPEYVTLRDNSAIQRLRVVFGKPKVYNVTLGLERDNQPFVTVRIGIRTTLLESTFRPFLIEALTYVGVAIFISLIAAAFVANLALQPLEQISSRLDALSQAEAEPAGELESGRSSDAVVQVSHKIERLGRRMRNVEEVFSALKENLDQILSNLQDGIMLFTRDSRAVLVSRSVERFLEVSRDQLLGAEVHDIFDRNSVLGRTVRQAFDAGMSIVQEEITTEAGRRVELSLDFIHDDQNGNERVPDQGRSLGALLTLHDVESVSEIESELELSRRMAAIGRLTSGVGHEVKNPINAIVVHLELLRSKIGSEAAATRHLEVIQSEIHRLDRVVQTLVDFSRPVELQLHEQDLRAVIGDVLALSAAELSTHNVLLVSHLPEKPLMVNIDADLLKQAAINVIQNGAQSMPEGGTLQVILEEQRK